MAGTMAVICVGELTVKLALMEPNLTEVAPSKLVPERMTGVPTAPLSGVKLVILGRTLKTLLLDVEPPGVITVM